jgi:violaxanthin de-epoxidase
VGTCLLANCQASLAGCLSDGTCAANLICLNACAGRPDETGCQIKCGDKYADAAIDAFNKCAVSEKKCVPQRVDKDAFPTPPDCAQDANFDLAPFTGRWFISAGLNPLFDTFDCQAHFFATPAPDKVVGRINWRIPNGVGAGGKPDFSERSTVQTFVQDPANKAHLINHGNEYLHYEDDWYVLASKPDSYVFVYYQGNNDAWRGYGGAVVYTRSASLPPDLVPELAAAAEAAGLKWADFALTDNACGPHPPPESLAEKAADLERAVEAVEAVVVGEAQTVERAVEAEARSLEAAVEADVEAVERVLVGDVMALRKAARIEAAALREAKERFSADLRSFGKFTVLGSGQGAPGGGVVGGGVPAAGMPGGMPAPAVAMDDSPAAVAARAAEMEAADAALRKVEEVYARPSWLPSFLGGPPAHARK